MRLAARSRARSARTRRGSTRSSGHRLRWCQVLAVADLVAELALRSLDGRLPDREMSHEVVRRGTVPVPFARRRVDGIAGADLDELAAPGLDPPDALGHMDRLSDLHALRAPGAKRTTFTRTREGASPCIAPGRGLGNAQPSPTSGPGRPVTRRPARGRTGCPRCRRTSPTSRRADEPAAAGSRRLWRPARGGPPRH